MNSKDGDGLSPLMRAVALGRNWPLRRVSCDADLLAEVDMGVRTDAGGENLLAYCLRHLVWGEDDEDGYGVVLKMIGRARWDFQGGVRLLRVAFRKESCLPRRWR